MHLTKLLIHYPVSYTHLDVYKRQVKYCHLFHIDSHITPHMFRHTFATMMLEEDVDIRYIQEILGHSSITTTQIYTHMSAHKQKEIMSHKNPRNKIHHYFS